MTSEKTLVYDPDIPGGRPLNPGEVAPGRTAETTAKGAPGRKSAGGGKSGASELALTRAQLELVDAIAKMHSGLPRMAVSGHLEFHDVDVVTGMGHWMVALGTGSVDFFMELVEHCRRAASYKGKINESKFNAALAFVAAIKPRGHEEVALAVQMATTHALVMEAIGDLSQAELQFQSDDAERRVSKYSKLYAMQMDVLKRCRAGQPVVTVQNVSVADGAQAVVASAVQVGKADENAGILN